MSDDEFRQHVIDTYAALADLYLSHIEISNSFATAAGAHRYLAKRAGDAGLPPLSAAETRAISEAITSKVARDNERRGGEKRIESVEVVEKVNGKIIFAVIYSDMEVIHAHAFREHALRRDNPWSRGGGWPDVSFDWALAAESRGSAL